LCRIAQEAITNIIKHARARQAIVRLEAGPEAVCLRVIDDGVGFDLAVVPTSPTRLSLGLATMRERAAAMGGCLEVQSAPGRGTCIIVWMPR
jgi:two-component system NarL family sensor kinase